MLLLVISGVFFSSLQQPGLSAPTADYEPQNGAVCIEKDCYSLFWAQKRFQGASKMCEKLGGHLMTVRSTVAADAIALMLQAHGAQLRHTANLWIGLQLAPGDCSEASKKLRGFYWVTGDEDTDYSHWQPWNKTACGPLCVTVGGEQGGWQEEDCTVKAAGFLCEFAYNGTCSPLSVAPAETVLYTAPFRIEGRDFLALPPGTRAAVPALGLELVCVGEGEHPNWSWDRPGAWDCRAEAGGCQGECQVGYAGSPPRCSCAAGERLGADGRSCSPPPGPCDTSPCQHLCVPHAGRFTCMCHEGFELAGDGRTCRDVDDCALTPGVCEHRCTNTEGSFACACFEGYEMVDGKCEDIDECFDPAVEMTCQHECVNEPGAYRCECHARYRPDPLQPGQCRFFCDGSVCPAECSPHVANAECLCPEGYVLDDDERENPDCVDIDECDARPCDGECVNLLGSYRCLCPAGQLLQADQSSCRAEEAAGEEGSGATDSPERATRAPPPTTAAPPPPKLDSFGIGILLGVVVGIVSMVFFIVLVHCYLKRHYAARTALDYKCQSREKEVVLQRVSAGPMNSNGGT
ncbi:thrombomodulin [Rhinatrema bivittatum]|uniref:thrombomodulin n=1 Tax=Rhinatrema bivittatum TaxID=194408 RepID=UPI001128FB34|nr:thrombomodulin [Rhinatrema bivittatum]